MSANQNKTDRRVPERDFCHAYCGSHKCPNEAFVETVFWQCMYPRTRPLARVIHYFAPSFFEADLAMIKAVGQASSVAEIQNEIDLHRYYTPPDGLLRRQLKVRVSGKRVVNLAARVLG